MGKYIVRGGLEGEGGREDREECNIVGIWGKERLGKYIVREGLEGEGVRGNERLEGEQGRVEKRGSLEREGGDDWKVGSGARTGWEIRSREGERN